MISFKDVFPSKLCEDGFLYSLLNMLKRVGAKNVDFDTMYHPSNADRDKVVITASLSDDSVEDVVKIGNIFGRNYIIREDGTLGPKRLFKI